MKATIKNIYIVNPKGNLATYLTGEFNSLDLRQFQNGEKEYYFVKELTLNIDGRKKLIGYSDIIQAMEKQGYVQADNNRLLSNIIKPTKELNNLMDKLDIDKLKKMYYDNNNEFLKMEVVK